MALTRKFLSAMGIEEDKIDQIITAHAETVTGLKERIDSLQVDADKLPEVQKELDEAQKTIKQMPKEAYKEKYESVTKEYEEYKQSVEAEKTRKSKEHAYKKLLEAANINDKSIDAVVKASGTAIDGIELDADGNAINSESLIEGIKTEWAGFIVTESVEGVKTPTPPANNGGSNFESMSLAEKMQYANEHGTDEAVKAWLEGTNKE